MTEPVDVIGTATDAHFLKYELEIAPGGDTTFTHLKTGAAPVSNGVLGQLDPTLLINQIYDLRLTVFDTNGNQATAQVAVEITRNLKVGNFTLAYTDLIVPVSRIPVQVVRTYDSRDKAQGEFGVGWHLNVNTFRASANKVQGTGWQVFKSGTTFFLVPGSDHIVSVTVPSGKAESFDLQITPTMSPLVPFTSVQASFVARPGTLGTLVSLDNNNILIVDAQPGPVELLDDVTLNDYHPDRFRYTALDGTQTVVTRTHGVESVRDSNGNQVTISASGITHSAGPGIAFTRDSLGRTTAITDPKGQTQTYTYSPVGDLASQTDATGNTTTYFYTYRHDLVRIVDPLGRPLARTEYDDAGRIISLTDAGGHTTTFQHNLAARQDLVTDALGHATLIEYDERGNVLATTDPLGALQTFTYDAQDNQLSRTDALGATTTYTYDANNSLQPTMPTTRSID